MTNIAMVKPWPTIEIDGLPNFNLKWWIFPWRTVSHSQMVIKTNKGTSILKYCCLHTGELALIGNSTVTHCSLSLSLNSSFPCRLLDLLAYIRVHAYKMYPQRTLC